MARPRFALAKQEADRLLAKASIRKPSVDVDFLATEVCKVELRAAPFDGDMDGALIREPRQTPIVAVNTTLSPERRRFTIAHELGHLILHSDAYHVDTKIFLRNSLSSTAESAIEVEANQFAAHLLVPDWMLSESIDEYGSLDIEDLATNLAPRYGVSLQAMTLRLGKLLKYAL